MEAVIKDDLTTGVEKLKYLFKKDCLLPDILCAGYKTN